MKHMTNRKFKTHLNKLYPDDKPEQRPVFELFTGMRFTSLNEAAKYFGISYISVKRVCDGKSNATKDGYKFGWADV